MVKVSKTFYNFIKAFVENKFTFFKCSNEYFNQGSSKCTNKIRDTSCLSNFYRKCDHINKSQLHLTAITLMKTSLIIKTKISPMIQNY